MTRQIIATATDVIVHKALVMVYSGFVVLGKTSFSMPLSDEMREAAVAEAHTAANASLSNNEPFETVDADYVRQRADAAWTKAIAENEAMNK